MSVESNVEQEVHDFRSGAEKVKQNAQEVGEQLKKNSTDAWDDFVDVVRRHPGKALSIALAAGVAVGTTATALSKRRSSSTVDKLRDLKDNGADAWETLRGGFSEAVCKLKDAVDEAASKLK